MPKLQKPGQKFISKGISEKTNSTKIKKSEIKPLKENSKLVRLLSTTVEKVDNATNIKGIKYNKEKDNLKNKKMSLKNAPSQKAQTKQRTTEKKNIKAKKLVGNKLEGKINKDDKDENVIERKAKKVKQETSKISSSLKFQPSSFNEKLFKDIVKFENILKIAKALKELVEKQVSEKKTSIFSDYRYFLNVACYKIPNCPKRMVKLNVKHSLVDTNTDDVVIIVPDLQRGRKIDYEPTIQLYEDLLQQNGITGIKVVPFNQLRNEYTTIEAKRKFANTYDYFLCDGRIVGHTVGFCGSTFQKPRTTLHAVHLSNTKACKSNIESALKRTCYKQIRKGNLISIPVGNHRFTTNHLADNIEMVINQLKTIFPGGYANIRNIYVKIDIKGTSSLPLYVSLAGAPAETPNVVGPREQRMLKLKKQANNILSKFSLSKTGDFVKLTKLQVERKQQIREAREALLSKEYDTELTPPSKKMKTKINQIEAGNNSAIDIEFADQGEEVEDEHDDDEGEEDEHEDDEGEEVEDEHEDDEGEEVEYEHEDDDVEDEDENN